MTRCIAYSLFFVNCLELRIVFTFLVGCKKEEDNRDYIWLANSFQSCPTLCDCTDYRPPGSSVHGILQARILVWIAMPSSRGSFQPKDQTCISYVSCIGRRSLFTTSATWKAHVWLAKPKILLSLLQKMFAS